MPLALELVRDDAVVDAANRRQRAVTLIEQLRPSLTTASSCRSRARPTAARSSRSRAASSDAPAESPSARLPPDRDRRRSRRAASAQILLARQAVEIACRAPDGNAKRRRIRVRQRRAERRRATGTPAARRAWARSRRRSSRTRPKSTCTNVGTRALTRARGTDPARRARPPPRRSPLIACRISSSPAPASVVDQRPREKAGRFGERKLDGHADTRSPQAVQELRVALNLGPRCVERHVAAPESSPVDRQRILSCASSPRRSRR